MKKISNSQVENSHYFNAKEKQNLADELKVYDKLSLKKMITELKKEAIDEEKIKFLKDNIKTLNKDFSENLKAKHSVLTKTDIEVCSFIKIGLSRKEIAKIRNTSLEAIKSTRFRLKKKLELSKDEKLDEYIQSI